jgi:hypothetical protein
MALAQALIGDAQALLAAAVGGFGLVLGAMAGSALAFAGFTLVTALARAPTSRPTRMSWR